MWTALDQIANALDQLGADGVVLLSNYHGTYLFDPRFRPVFDDLDHRGGFPLATQLPSLLRLVPPSHLLYGTDWPFTPQPQITESARRIAHTRPLSGHDRDLIRHRNARQLFKRFTPSDTPDHP